MTITPIMVMVLVEPADGYDFLGTLQLAEPFGTMARCVNLLAGTGDGPASVDRLQATHHPREIFGDRKSHASCRADRG